MSLIENLSGVENCFLGFLSGCLSKMTNYPLLVFKNNQQQGLKNSYSPSIVYRGLPVAMINLGGTTSIQFVATGMFQKFVRNFTNNDQHVQIGGAFLGGVLSAMPCSLWELTMIQQQRFGGSIISTPQNIYLKHGLTGFTRGLPMTLGRESLFTFCMLGITPIIKNKLIEKEFSPRISLLSSSIISGIIAGIITHPFDTIKTCQQGDIGGEKYRSSLHTYKVITRHNILHIYNGFGWRVGLIASTFFLINTFKETLIEKYLN